MEKKKQIVAHFNETLEKILFYTIEDHNENYTLLRRQGTEEYLVYDKDSNTYAKVGRFNTWDKIDIYSLEWKFDRVFFWADSPFVTKYGSREYDMLIKTYKQLLELREADIMNMLKYEELMDTLPLFERIKMFFYYKIVIKHQENVVRKQMKGLKIIW